MSGGHKFIQHSWLLVNLTHKHIPTSPFNHLSYIIHSKGILKVVTLLLTFWWNIKIAKLIFRLYVVAGEIRKRFEHGVSIYKWWPMADFPSNTATSFPCYTLSTAQINWLWNLFVKLRFSWIKFCASFYQQEVLSFSVMLLVNDFVCWHKENNTRKRRNI